MGAWFWINWGPGEWNCVREWLQHCNVNCWNVSIFIRFFMPCPDFAPLSLSPSYLGQGKQLTQNYLVQKGLTLTNILSSDGEYTEKFMTMQHFLCALLGIHVSVWSHTRLSMMSTVQEHFQHRRTALFLCDCLVGGSNPLLHACIVISRWTKIYSALHCMWMKTLSVWLHCRWMWLHCRWKNNNFLCDCTVAERKPFLLAALSLKIVSMRLCCR